MALDFKDELEKLLQMMGLEFDFIEEICEDETIILDIATPQHAQFYGQKGQTLSALQYIFRVILWKKGNEDQQVNIDLNSVYRSQYEQVRKKTREGAQKVMESVNQFDLPAMNPTHRRIAHLTIQDEFPDLTTKSIEDRGWKFVRIIKKD